MAYGLTITTTLQPLMLCLLGFQQQAIRYYRRISYSFNISDYYYGGFRARLAEVSFVRYGNMNFKVIRNDLTGASVSYTSTMIVSFHILNQHSLSPLASQINGSTLLLGWIFQVELYL